MDTICIINSSNNPLGAWLWVAPPLGVDPITHPPLLDIPMMVIKKSEIIMF